MKTETDSYSLVLAEFIPLGIWHSEFAHQYPQNTQEEDEINLEGFKPENGMVIF